MNENPTFVHPDDIHLLAAVTNLVLGRKKAVQRNMNAFLTGEDVQKIMHIISILNEPPTPTEADRYGKPVTDTIPTGDELAAELGDTARRGLRARMDGQQPLPKE